MNDCSPKHMSYMYEKTCHNWNKNTKWSPSTACCWAEFVTQTGHSEKFMYHCHSERIRDNLFWPSARKCRALLLGPSWNFDYFDNARCPMWLSNVDCPISVSIAFSIAHFHCLFLESIKTNMIIVNAIVWNITVNSYLWIAALLFRGASLQ